jgi:hypothetical protein
MKRCHIQLSNDLVLKVIGDEQQVAQNVRILFTVVLLHEGANVRIGFDHFGTLFLPLRRFSRMCLIPNKLLLANVHKLKNMIQT